MKVVAFNGSPRARGNTDYGINLVAGELKKEGIEVEIVNVGSQQIRGCISCYHCMKNKSGECVIKTDKVNEYIQKMKDADGILLGSPTYIANIGGNMKNFLDRALFVMEYGSTVSPLRHKVGAGIIAVRRSGDVVAFDALNHALSTSEMFIPTSNYWNVIHGLLPGDAEKDEEGKQTMRLLGKNMAYLLKMKEAAKHIKAPDHEEKIMTNFIR